MKRILSAALVAICFLLLIPFGFCSDMAAATKMQAGEGISCYEVLAAQTLAAQPQSPSATPPDVPSKVPESENPKGTLPGWWLIVIFIVIISIPMGLMMLLLRKRSSR